MSVAAAAGPGGQRQPAREPVIQGWLVLGALGVLAFSVGVGIVLGPTTPGRPTQLGQGGTGGGPDATAGAPAASGPASPTGLATPSDRAVPTNPAVATNRAGPTNRAVPRYPAVPRNPTTGRPRTTTTPVVPPPSVTPTASPTPEPTPTAVVVHEAEAAGNTLTGSAVVAAHPDDPGGAIVTGIGLWDDDPGTLAFTGVTVPASGLYAVTIHYVHAEATGDRSAQVTVAGEPPVHITTTGTGGTVVVQLPLAYGLNTITVGNPYARAPDIDRIEVAQLPS